MVDSFKYIKPYQGRWHKEKKLHYTKEDIVYYLEREWRYCPSINDFRVLSGTKPANQFKIEKYNQQLKTDLSLKFEPDDVKYILIKEKSEIDDFVREIGRMKIEPKQQNELITHLTQKSFNKNRCLARRC